MTSEHPEIHRAAGPAGHGGRGRPGAARGRGDRDGLRRHLIYAELVEIGQICPYCTSVHIITFSVFALILFQTALRPNES